MTLFTRIFRRSKFNERVPTLLTAQRCTREEIQAAFARIDRQRARLAKEQNAGRRVRK